MQAALPRLAAAALLALPVAATAAPITVTVTDVPAATGIVHVDICRQDQFLKEDCSWSGEAPAAAGTVTVTIADVPPGRYAAQGFHDANGNGKVDRNMLGIPKERVGFSNDAPVHFRPPRFDAAAFDHGATAQTIQFRLRHFP